MKNPLVKVVKDFFVARYEIGKPVLLGYSGGVDSSALLSLLLDCRPFFLFDLQIVHFDHAWRDESLEQAQAMKRYIEGLGLTFHGTRSDQMIWKQSNKEEKAREERFTFFQQIYKKVGAQALILGHQREDLAETVLKRVCEGAGLLSLEGMQNVSFYQAMTIWRPLLFTTRKDLIDWNQEKGLTPLADSTNEDLQFLRPRMRQKIFPELEKWFGKGVQKNIALLGEEFSLLKNHVQEKLRPFLQGKPEGFLGFALLYNTFSCLDRFEKQELIRASLQERGVRIGKESLRRIITLLEDKGFDKKVDVSAGELIIDNGSLFWLCSREGKDWEIKRNFFPSAAPSLLHMFLQGKIYYKVGKGEEVVFCEYDFLSRKDKKRFASFFSQNKIPATMRRFFPFLKKKEFLIDVSCLVVSDLFIDNVEDIVTINLKNISN